MSKRPQRVQTEQALVAAVGQLLAEQGFRSVGVNALCARAGVNKALLYRYFGGLDGLLAAYAEHGDFWPALDEVTGDPAAFAALSPAARADVFIRGYARALEARPQTLAILAWETVERNELTAGLEGVRERWSQAAALRLLGGAAAGQEEASSERLAALGAVVSATVHYLLLRRRHIRLYGGLDLSAPVDDAPWVDVLVEMVQAVLGR